MTTSDAGRLFEKGLENLAQGNTPSALAYFERAVRIEDAPLYSSYFAFCIAKERGQFQLAVTLCEKAMARDAQNPIHYLNLGKVYLLAGKKSQAIEVFRKGLAHERHQEIIDELNRLGIRKSPVLPFLKRKNPINRYFGIILHRLGLR